LPRWTRPIASPAANRSRRPESALPTPSWAGPSLVRPRQLLRLAQTSPWHVPPASASNIRWIKSRFVKTVERPPPGAASHTRHVASGRQGGRVGLQV